ncbi:MAG: glycosyltransferase, partial [Terriglobales bacterium]
MPSVMHVELGGSYGGSLRALELYLQYCDRARLQHHLLLVQPVEGPVESMERLRPLVSSLRILTPGCAPGGRGRALPRPSALRRLEPWLLLAARAPQARRLAKIFRASGCSLIHCNNTFTCQASTLLAARWAGLPLIAHVRNPVGGGAAGPRRYERWLAQQAQRFIALHAGQEEQLRGLGVRGEIFRCGDGIELPPAGAGRVAALRRQFVPEGGLLLGSLGRLEEQKGYDALIEAAAGVLPHHPRARLVIFGEGGERQRLRGAIARLGLEGRVLLPGFTSDRASALAALDLFVCSSRWEGVPLSVLEAMLAGKPVVATQAALAGEPRLLRWLAAPAAGPGAESLAAALAAAMTAAMTCALQQGYGAGNCRDARAWA